MMKFNISHLINLYLGVLSINPLWAYLEVIDQRITLITSLEEAT